MSLKDLNIISTDSLRRDFVLPSKILYKTDGVYNEDIILKSTISQAYQGQKNAMVLSSENGNKAGILLDFGTELTGGIRLVTGESDWTKNRCPLVRIRFGESATEALTPIGQKNATNDHGTRDFVIPLALLSTTEWGQTGFRFVYIELEEPDFSLQLVSIHAIFTYRDLKYFGSFECDDDEINKIYETARYTAHLNMQNYLIEGVKRDRMIWNGDLFAMLPSLQYIFGNQNIIADSLRFIADTVILPNYWNNFTSESFRFFMTLDKLYMYTADVGLSNELKYYWKPLLKQVLKLVNEEKPHLRKEQIVGYFYDWTTEHNEDATMTGFQLNFILGLEAAKNICKITFETELYDECKHKIDLLNDKDFNHYNNFAIATELYLTGKISTDITAEIYKNEGINSMSAAKAHKILTVMSKTLGKEFALDVLKKYYGSMLRAGATTFWEFFKFEWYRENSGIDRVHKPGEYDIHADNGQYCFEGLRHSLCHAWGSSPVAFLVETVLGVTIIEKGYKKLSVKPQLCHLKWVKGSIPTPFGIVYIDAKNENGKIVTKIDAPKEIEIVE